MKFLDYITEIDRRTESDTRARILDHDEFYEGVKKNCSDALKAIPILRGTNTTNAYSFISPGKHLRRSRNTENWYTLLLNDSSRWAKYPKRSLICTLDKDNARAYGHHTYRVFPVNGAKIGICSKHDLWWSFPKTAPAMTMDTFNVYLGELFSKANPGKSVSDESWGHMKYYAKAVPEFFERERNSGNFAINYLLEKKYDGSDFIKWLEKLLDPEDNGFMLKTIDELPKNLLFAPREVWTDADCYMIARSRR